MENVTAFILGALQILLIDITLCGDNVGVIALAIRRLPPEKARKASLIGISGAVFLRIVFASIIGYIMMIDWLPIRLAGGILLVKITWDLIKGGDSKESKIKEATGFWSAVASIIIADFSMSLDNVLAIGGASHGNLGLIAFGLILIIPILFFGSKFVADMMKKYKIVIYIGGAILAHTAFNMIVGDDLIVPYVNHIFAVIFPWSIALLTIAYGFYIIKKEKKLNMINMDNQI